MNPLLTTIEICDCCAQTIAPDKIVHDVDYVFCSAHCREKYREKLRVNPFNAVRPARYHLGE